MVDKTSKISLQQIFNAGWQAFIVENKRPSIVGGVSRYLTPDGDKCIVGLCLPDGPIQNHLYSFNSLVLLYPELFDAEINAMARSAEEGVPRLSHFQAKLHDNICYWDIKNSQAKWRFNLDMRKETYLEVAEEFNLTVPE